jgi:hypothetical protein
MSSEPPKDTSADRPTEPFARGKITWGRPPQQVFRVGPLPSVGVAPTPRAATRDVLTGSMIPQARPVAEPEAPEAPIEETPSLAPETILPPPPLEPEPVIEPVFASVAAPEPVVEPEPIVAAPASQEIVIEPEAAEPAVTVPPLSGDAGPAAKPRELPSVVVTPTLYATMGAAVQNATKGGGRWAIVAAVAALAVIGGFIWLATLPAPRPVAPVPTPLAAGAAPLEEPPLAEVETPAAAAPEAASVPAPAAPASAAAPRRPAPSSAAPVVVTPPSAAATAPRPYSETAPLVVEPPTPAAPAQTDPDAPIATRPQPLD